MKHLKFISLLAMLTLFSCQQELQETVVAPEQDGEHITITATAGEPGSKTVVHEDGSIWWSPKDTISVFYGDCNLGKFVSLKSNEAQTTVFASEKTFIAGSFVGAEDMYWGVYPYSEGNSCDGSSVTLSVPAEQTAVANSYDPKAFPSVGCSTTQQMAFYNVCGGVRFQLATEGVTSVTMKGNGDDVLAGKVKVDFDDEGHPEIVEVSEPKVEVTLTCEAGFQTGVWYYIATLPVSLENGVTFTLLKDNKTAVRTINNSLQVKRSIFGSITNLDEGLTFVSVEAVDLGLSVKWAATNVGAEHEWEIGNRYAWGEVEPKSYYDWSNYLLCEGAYYNLTKYCSNPTYGQVDGLSRLMPEDDIVSISYGDGWRMPTRSEMKELIDNCTWTWTTNNGVNGYVVTGPNQNNIFIPANGQFDEIGITNEDNVYIWTSESDGAYWGYNLSASSSRRTIGLNHRHDGLSVRAVCPISSSSPDPQLPEINDLSAEGTANCYIVSEYGSCKFDATKKGHTTESVGAIATAEVLWESFGNDVRPRTGDVVSNVSVKDGIVTFTASGKDGNAVIAVKDAAGDILWSWHIWVCEGFDPVATAQVYYNNAGTVMDRNLGATSAAKGDVKSFGLLYQWGRKDPFLGSAFIVQSDLEYAESTISWWPYPVASNAFTGTIDYVVKNPTTFVTNNSLNYDWYYTGSSSHENTRWNHNKGMYDPCPKGWRVPDGGDNGLWAKALGSASEFMGAWDYSNNGIDFTNQFSAAPEVWYPASGFRYSINGSLINVASESCYWSCSTDGTYPTGLSLSDFAGVCPAFYDYRTSGLSVRCVKESATENEPVVTDLSADGTANCYIVSEYGPCKFDATKKGHTNESVGAIASAEVLWESFGNDVQPEVGDIVSNVNVKDGIVCFTASGKDGNAVIAVKDAAGDILWSWHIWVCHGYNADATAQVYYNNTGTVMDRNLGATSATKGDVKALGLLYQWGRKDPFLSGESISSSTRAKSTITWPSAVRSDASNGTIDYVVKHPTTFLLDNSKNADWYYTGNISTDNIRWSSVKGMYDPCPKGWRVPDGGDSGFWAKAFGTMGPFSKSSNWDSTNLGMDFGTTHMALGSGTIWYPASGVSLHTAGSLDDVGSTGSYWSCSTSTAYDHLACYFDFNYAGYVYPSRSCTRASGKSVRCVKQ